MFKRTSKNLNFLSSIAEIPEKRVCPISDLMLRCLVNTLTKTGDEQKECKQSARYGYYF